MPKQMYQLKLDQKSQRNKYNDRKDKINEEERMFVKSYKVDLNNYL